MKWLSVYNARKLAHTSQNVIEGDLETIINSAINQIDVDSRRGHFSTCVYVPQKIENNLNIN